MAYCSSNNRVCASFAHSVDVAFQEALPVTLYSIFSQKQREKVQATIAAQVAHDIRSPLAALEVLESDLATLPEKKRILLRSAINRIRDIANKLHDGDAKEAAMSMVSITNSPYLEGLSSQLLFAIFESLITEKRLQFRARPGIEIDGRLDGNRYGIFARIQPAEFKRIISNLVNNSAESIVDRGRVTLTLSDSRNMVHIEIEDNGKGIPAEVLPRLMNRGETFGKPGGSGLGLWHARTVIESWDGHISIAPTPDIGTKVSIDLPKTDTPPWFVAKLIIKPASRIIVLDDDVSIHQIWRGRLESLRLKEGDVELVNFSTPKDLRDYVKTRWSSRDLYLVDYELLGHSETGLDIIEATGIMEQSVLVTSRFEEPEIRARCEQLNVKLIPKALAGFVPIEIESAKDAVLIADDC